MCRPIWFDQAAEDQAVHGIEEIRVRAFPESPFGAKKAVWVSSGAAVLLGLCTSNCSQALARHLHLGPQSRHQCPAPRAFDRARNRALLPH